MESDISICKMRAILTNLTSRMSEFPRESTKEDTTSLTYLIDNLNHLGDLIETRMRKTPKQERERSSKLSAALVNGKKAFEEAKSNFFFNFNIF